MKLDYDLSGVKVPKRVAGVKLPKPLRKGAKTLLAKANSPAGKEAIAAGLTIAGAAIAANVKAKAEARAAKGAAPRAGPEAKTTRLAAGTGGDAAPAREPGASGIDPNLDLGAVVTAGLGALQTFLAGRKPG